MTDFPISGGCICGSVRYEINAPANCVVHCHCSMCRHSSAGLVNTLAITGQDQFVIQQGEDNLSNFEDIPPVRRRFCRSCGCSLYYTNDDLPGILFYYPATLDDGVHPGHPKEKEAHVHVNSMAEWDRITDKLPQFTEGPDNTILG